MSKIAIKLITKYQKHISPFLKEQGYKCLFEPTCSQYALGCFEKHSFFKASVLTVFRVFISDTMPPAVTASTFDGIIELSEPGFQSTLSISHAEIDNFRTIWKFPFRYILTRISKSIDARISSAGKAVSFRLFLPGWKGIYHFFISS